MPEEIYHTIAHGKLLLTGEYFVLDAVPALAVPTRLGQSLQVLPAPAGAGHDLSWRAYTVDDEPWFQGDFNRAAWSDFSAQTQVQTGDTGARICQLLSVAENLRPGCTDSINGLEVITRLGFDRHWGLGSSSTLVAGVAGWLQVNPYALLQGTFGGSGYDLACAVADGPIIYTRNGTTPAITSLNWQPTWLQQTCFVYRNQKQDSRAGIRAYRERKISAAAKSEIGELTVALTDPSLHLRAAAQIVQDHEKIVAETLGLRPVQEELFPDFPGQLKSLGAWGGDFCWALSEEPAEKVRAYFNERGYETVITYASMVK